MYHIFCIHSFVSVMLNSSEANEIKGKPDFITVVFKHYHLCLLTIPYYNTKRVSLNEIVYTILNSQSPQKCEVTTFQFALFSVVATHIC